MNSCISSLLLSTWKRYKLVDVIIFKIYVLNENKKKLILMWSDRYSSKTFKANDCNALCYQSLWTAKAVLMTSWKLLGNMDNFKKLPD